MLTGKAKSAKRLKPGIKYDAVNPTDYLLYDFRTACEDCTHFDVKNQSCTMGYDPQWHLREFQKSSYYLSGKIAQCRFLEVD
jgi:hypothetical protein